MRARLRALGIGNDDSELIELAEEAASLLEFYAAVAPPPPRS